MPCSAKWQHIQRNYLNKTLTTLLGHGIDPFSTPFLSMVRSGEYIDLHIGFKLPKPVTFLLKLFGLSPGEISLWFDGESGFFTEARAKEGASPVYHHVTDEVAIKLLKGELTHELEAALMTPDDYLGE